MTLFSQLVVPNTSLVTADSTQTLTNKTLNSPTLVTPNLGTPSAGVLTNATGLPIVAGTTGTLSVARGGTSAVTFTANNILLGNGTSTFQEVAPGIEGNVLTSNGTTWVSGTSSKDFVLLQTVDITSSVTTIELATSSTYDRYLILLDNIVSATLTGSSTAIQFGTGSPVTYITSGYSWGLIRNGATTPVQGSATSATSAVLAQYQNSNATIRNMVVEVGGVTSGTFAHCMANTLSGARDTILGGGNVSKGGSNVTSIKLFFGAAATGGKAYLYGLSST